ncbi:tyrosine-type recombinase/integrase [uncultured Pseudodesulfovibrio sp.]|uniref:tyrosine-type recombinase/integrase n=1 Tax=uncultured Pseudodesulfovibrio sp. TaxID=2035858 RepID=UPI0029C6ED12|nr:tyrosine-type recombinase/integrase [uncultured Pseudodesulfovibrio sp.]
MSKTGARIFTTASQVKKFINEGIRQPTLKPFLCTEPAPRGSGRLVLRVRGCVAEWLFRFNYGGKRKMMKLGNAAGKADMTLAEAREAVMPCRRLLLDGLDPQAVRNREKKKRKMQERINAERGTVKQLFEYYIEDMKGRGASSWAQVEYGLLTGKYAAVNELGKGTKAAEVSKEDLIFLIKKIYKRGANSMAEKMRLYLHGAYQCAINNENSPKRGSMSFNFKLDGNPAGDIPADPDARGVGQRVLSKDEVKAAWNDMQEHGVSKPVHNALRLIIATGGQRVREVVEARIDEFDLEGRVWRMPGGRVKNGKDHHVPLSDRAIGIIRESICDGESLYLFPSFVDLDKPIRFTSLGRAVRRFLELTEGEHWTPRDLRRTARSMLAEAGEPGYRLNVHFNHGRTEGVGEKHYEHTQRMPDKMKVLVRWDALLNSILGEEERAKVLKIK